MKIPRGELRSLRAVGGASTPSARQHRAWYPSYAVSMPDAGIPHSRGRDVTRRTLLAARLTPDTDSPRLRNRWLTPHPHPRRPCVTHPASAPGTSRSSSKAQRAHFLPIRGTGGNHLSGPCCTGGLARRGPGTVGCALSRARRMSSPGHRLGRAPRLCERHRAATRDTGAPFRPAAFTQTSQTRPVFIASVVYRQRARGCCS